MQIPMATVRVEHLLAENSARFDLSPDDLARKIALGDFAIGSLHLATEQDLANGFAEGALVPTMLARECTVDDFNGLLAKPDTPSHLLVEFLDSLSHIPDLAETVERSVTVAAESDFRFQGIAERFNLGGHVVNLANVITSPPEQPTTIIPSTKIPQFTINDADSKAFETRVGVHIDNATEFRKEVSKRRDIHRNAVLNYPRSEAQCDNRWAVIVPQLSTFAISEVLFPGDKDHIPSTLDARDFVRLYPNVARDLTVIYARIRPYAGIIEPVGNIGHDGSTIGSHKPTRAIVYSGQFGRGALQLSA